MSRVIERPGAVRTGRPRAERPHREPPRDRRRHMLPTWLRPFGRCCALLAFGAALFAASLHLLPGPRVTVAESLRRDAVLRLGYLKPYLTDDLVARDAQAIAAVGAAAHRVVQEGESVGMRVL